MLPAGGFSEEEAPNSPYSDRGLRYARRRGRRNASWHLESLPDAAAAAVAACMANDAQASASASASSSAAAAAAAAATHSHRGDDVCSGGASYGDDGGMMILSQGEASSPNLSRMPRRGRRNAVYDISQLELPASFYMDVATSRLSSLSVSSDSGL